jgi:hypothetical protein
MEKRGEHRAYLRIQTIHRIELPVVLMEPRNESVAQSPAAIKPLLVVNNTRRGRKTTCG